MARVEALLPHPAAVVIASHRGDHPRGEPWSDQQTERPDSLGLRFMAAGLSPVAFFFSGNHIIRR